MLQSKRAKNVTPTDSFILLSPVVNYLDVTSSAFITSPLNEWIVSNGCCTGVSQEPTGETSAIEDEGEGEEIKPTQEESRKGEPCQPSTDHDELAVPAGKAEPEKKNLQRREAQSEDEEVHTAEAQAERKQLPEDQIVEDSSKQEFSGVHDVEKAPELSTKHSVEISVSSKQAAVVDADFEDASSRAYQQAVESKEQTLQSREGERGDEEGHTVESEVEARKRSGEQVAENSIEQVPSEDHGVEKRTDMASKDSMVLEAQREAVTKADFQNEWGNACKLEAVEKHIQDTAKPSYFHEHATAESANISEAHTAGSTTSVETLQQESTPHARGLLPTSLAERDSVSIDSNAASMPQEMAVSALPTPEPVEKVFFSNMR